ncbi:hypothetical protein AMECASPLE_035810 [Ameca splendens]|uniref:Secreted protein n=1 Tax=Ameca splendens TaxID=208324 RepID=A0ABV0XWI2_9TELE
MSKPAPCGLSTLFLTSFVICLLLLFHTDAFCFLFTYISPLPRIYLLSYRLHFTSLLLSLQFTKSSVNIIAYGDFCLTSTCQPVHYQDIYFIYFFATPYVHMQDHSSSPRFPLSAFSGLVVL